MCALDISIISQFQQGYTLFIMLASPVHQQQPALVPARFNKHFRIKSASKDKFKPSAEICTVRTRRKDGNEQMKRIFSESRRKKSASHETPIKIRITKEEFERKFEKALKSSNKNSNSHQPTKTEAAPTHDSHKTCRTQDDNQNEPELIPQKPEKGVESSQVVNNESSVQNSKVISQPERFKKLKGEKEGKGKYRCRVSQFVFEQARKKPNLSKEQQQTLDEFWKNVNESLILADSQEEEISKELQQFVEHLIYE